MLSLPLCHFLRFDRDWKKIEDFVGSKTVIQVIVSDSSLPVSYFSHLSISH